MLRLATADFNCLRTLDEVRRFLEAAEREGEHVHALYATAVWTGMRLGELAGLRWEDVDLDRRLITVSRSYGGPAKNDETRHVPILDVLLPILRRWRLRSGAGLVFTNQAGRMFNKDSRIFRQVLRRVLVTAEFDERYITFHDARYSFASHWMMRGGDMFRLQRILGHKSIEMTMRYAHLPPDALCGDFGRFGSAPEEASVLPLRSASSGTS